MDRWWRSSGSAARDIKSSPTCVRPEVLAFRHHGDDGCDIGLVFKSTVRLDFICGGCNKHMCAVCGKDPMYKMRDTLCRRCAMPWTPRISGVAIASRSLYCECGERSRYAPGTDSEEESMDEGVDDLAYDDIALSR